MKMDVGIGKNVHQRIGFYLNQVLADSNETLLRIPGKH
jgi:hypothetical protein